MKICPECKEDVKDDASKCSHCGSKLREVEEAIYMLLGLCFIMALIGAIGHIIGWIKELF